MRSADDAAAAAKRIGYPVVTKPLDGNHGRGVGMSIRSDRAVRTGFNRASKQSRSGEVVVEKMVEGSDYRILVVGGQMVAVAERVPAQVVGDGTHTVSELVDITNADPRRGIGHENVLTRIRLGEESDRLLREQKRSLELFINEVMPAFATDTEAEAAE